ncbi:MAG: hypothetical protein CV090_16750 [Nitrospira sp. WS238]|nr:hypothetical protein [Nitrospira sp. WS238]
MLNFYPIEKRLKESISLQHAGSRIRGTPVQFVAEIGEVQCDSQPFFWGLTPGPLYLVMSK